MINRQKVFQRICELLKSEYEVIVNEDGIQEGHSIIDNLGLDSLDRVELLIMCEEEFSIALPDEKFQEVITVGDAANVVWEEIEREMTLGHEPSSVSLLK